LSNECRSAEFWCRTPSLDWEKQMKDIRRDQQGTNDEHAKAQMELILRRSMRELTGAELRDVVGGDTVPHTGTLYGEDPVPHTGTLDT